MNAYDVLDNMNLMKFKLTMNFKFECVIYFIQNAGREYKWSYIIIIVFRKRKVYFFCQKNAIITT